MFPILSTVLLAALAAGADPVPAGVDLADLSGWDIVVDTDAIASEVYAAREFQRIFRQAGGAELPIVPDATRPDRHVFIGPGAAMGRSAPGFDVASFGREDLRLVVRDGNIVIAGGRPRGTLYGVYTFLEDYLGVRFLTADHTHVPPLGRWRRIGPVDRFYHPPMDWRWVAYEANYADPAFAARLRLNAARVPAEPVDGKDWSGLGDYGGRTAMRHIGHSFNRQLPPASYARERPEYYCLFRGKRWATLEPGEDGIDFKRGAFPYGMQPCLSHPDVLRIITKSVLDELASHPDVLNVSVAPNDGGAHCQCPSCAALDEREGTKMGALLTFVNQVAGEVARRHPDRMISTLAYSDTAAPPKTLLPRDNVQIMWCSIGTCFIHGFDDRNCRQNAWFDAQLQRWARITDHLYVWNYYLNDEHHTYQLPMPNLRLLDANIRHQVALGVRGMFMQATSSCHGNELEELRNYMLANLLWDPGRDGRQLMSEWLRLHYGRAAPPIRRWITRLHDRTAAGGMHCRCLGGSYAEFGLDESDIQAGMAAVEEAMALAGGDRVLRGRIEKATIWALRAAIEPVWYLKDGETVDPALAERMRPLVERFFDLCRKHGATRTKEGSHHQMAVFEGRLRALLGSWDAP